MKIELSHDILAKNIYDRASADAKMLLKVTNLIKGRYIYYIESKVLLTKEDLNYVESYLKKIELTDEEHAFVRRSKRVLKLRTIWSIVVAIIIIVALAGLTAWAMQGWRKANKNEKDVFEKKALLEQQNRVLANQRDELAREKRERLAAINDLSNKDKLLELSKGELEKVVQELEIKNIELKEALEKEHKLLKDLDKINKELADANKKLKGDVNTKSREVSSITAKVATIETESKKYQSRALSSRALLVLRQNNNRVLAAQLATEAYELDKENREACGILAELTGKNKGGDYFQRYAPANYEEMIINLRREHGRLKSSDKERYLKGMPTEAMQPIRPR